jgi:hypothetical protein
MNAAIALPRSLTEEEVGRLDPYPFFAVIGKRVIHPGGRTAKRAARELSRVCTPGGPVLATAFYWRMPPTPEARRHFLGEVCPGLQFDNVEDCVQLYTTAALSDVHVQTGRFDMMTPGGFLHDKGMRNAVVVMARALSRLCYVRKMAWLVPRVAGAVPYLGFILVNGTKRLAAEGV